MSVDTVPVPAPADSASAAPELSTSPSAAGNRGGAMSPGGNNSNNQANNGQFTLRALVSSKEAGIIIGKAGKNVADLREATGVKAGVSKVVQGVPERVLSVTGTLDGVTKAYTTILQSISENPTASNPALASGVSSSIHLKLLVANPVMGSVIGKAGATIQALQAKHSAKIVTVKEMLPNSTERIVSVEGNLAAVDATLADLIKIISEQDVTRLQNQILYQPGSAASQTGIGGMMGGAVAGGPMYGGANQQGGSGGGYNNHHNNNNNNGGHQQQRSYPNGGGRGGNRNVSGGAGGAGGNMNGITRNATGAAASQAVPTPSNPDLRTQNISIPSDMVGCIIGRGGSKINEIRQQSGAKISIAKDAHDESGERMFTITGSSEALEKALYLLYGQLEGEKEKRIQNQKQEMEMDGQA